MLINIIEDYCVVVKFLRKKTIFNSFLLQLIEEGSYFCYF